MAIPPGWTTVRIRKSTHALALEKAKAWANAVGLRPDRSLAAWVDKVLREAGKGETDRKEKK